ncbi:MAG: antA/AntB antirepressor family protein [Deltaproteobacteria bacterium]|jgi:hypothetical protein|nr:antA/AntB antirepressor family protein [Deltaproteobacteria bacterium]
MLKQYGFKENVDFFSFSKNLEKPRGGRLLLTMG